MKSIFLTFITLLTIVTVSTTSASAATNNTNDNTKTGTLVTEAANFSKIEVRGNVAVYITNGEANTVRVYNNYYGESALVQNQNGVLRISSYAKDQLVVYVTAAELRALSVYDNAVVKSYDRFSSIELDVNLYNNATAQLNLEAYQATINVNDRAKADLSGNVTQCNMNINQASTVNSTNFMAEHLTKNMFGKPDAAKATGELAII